jgi:outer membrane cobalamin receptor
MKKNIINLLLLFLVGTIQAQIIKGKITNSNNDPLPGANIYIKGSYDGSVSGTDGTYSFQTNRTDSLDIIISYIGYRNTEITIAPDKTKPYILNIVLEPKNVQINEIVITAGNFVANDKKRGFQMSTLDILTTANSNGDIPSALATLPGVQKVSEEGGIFVRGGENYETKNFVDGMLVTNPYSSKIPDIPMRGRFSADNFSGVSFNTGGYSAEYGQALSSVLILQTYPFPTISQTNISIMPFGCGINHTWKHDLSSLALSMDYTNMKPYYSVVRQKTNWVHTPEKIQTTLMYRKKLRDGGLLKSFISFSRNHLGLILPDYLAENNSTNLNMYNTNLYANSVFAQPLSSQWSLKAGISLNYDDELIHFENFSADTYNRALQAKIMFQNKLSNSIILKFGGEFNYQKYQQDYTRNDSVFEEKTKFSSPLAGLFAETEWRVTQKLFCRIGARIEYAELIKNTSIVPRFSMAYKTSKNSQISIAYGIFSQLPQDNYLKFNSNLTTEKAAHYIINYEYTKDKRLFRVEAYSKEYSDLVRYSYLNNPKPDSYNNTGHGYARGFDLFLRDEKTFHNTDYRISYSYLDTRKLYRDMPSLERPYLFSKHTFNFVGKYYASRIHTQFGLTYQYSSARPYYKPTENKMVQCFTNDFNELSANLSYLTSLFNCFTIIHFSVSNVLGADPIYGYHYYKQNGTADNYTAYPIKSAAKRFYVIGIFITLGKEYASY